MIQQLITLQRIKKHLNIDPDFTEDDDLIGLYADAAVDAVSRHLSLDQPLDELYATEPVPAAIQNVILLLIGEMYNRRELTTSDNVNDTKIFGYLVGLYRNLTV